MKNLKSVLAVIFACTIVVTGCSSNKSSSSATSKINTSSEAQITQDTSAEKKPWTDEYTFPMSEDLIIKETSKLSQKWNLESSKNFNENYTNFHFKNDKGITCSIDTRGDKSSRGIGASFFYPSDMNAANFLNSQEIEELFILQLNLYCDTNKEDAIKGFKKFQDEDKSEKEISTWVYRKDGTHYLVTFSSPNNQSVLQPQKIQILDSLAYDEMLASTAASFENHEKLGGSVESLTTNEFEAYPAADEENPTAIKIAGKLSNIKLNDSAIKLPKALDKKIDPAACSTAVLMDKAGEMQVVLIPTTLTQEELSQERNHYIIKYKDGAVIYASVK